MDNYKEKIVVEMTEGKVCRLKEFGSGHKEAWNIIFSAYQNKKSEGGSSSFMACYWPPGAIEEPVLEDEEEEKKQDQLSLSPTDDDWKIILEGTRAVRYEANQPVVRQEQEQHQRIFQIAKGYTKSFVKYWQLAENVE